MNLDPVLFENSMYETANDAVLFCKEYLERNDNENAALTLQNICPITDEVMATFARQALVEVLPSVKGAPAREYVRIALGTVDRALAGERGPCSVAA